MSILTGSDILVTGGTGSFGRAFVRHALDQLNPRRLIVFSRDELKQWEVRQLFGDDPRLRFFLGDVRDRSRLLRAMHRVDYVVHAAALKQVDSATTRFTPESIAASMTFCEPTTLVWTNSHGLYSPLSTCFRAAAWMT